MAAAADDATVGVARPDIRVLHEGDRDDRLRLCVGLQLLCGERQQLEDPGVNRARVARVFLFLDVSPVALLLGEPAHVGGQLGDLSIVAQSLRDRAALAVARRAEHLARASPVRDVSLLGRLRARCALVLALAECEREAVLRHCCCVGGVCRVEGDMSVVSLSNYSNWGHPLFKFFFSLNARPIADARA